MCAELNDNLSRLPDPELSLALARHAFFALDSMLSLLPPGAMLMAGDIGALTRLISNAAQRGTGV